ncbi:hypothetical protein IU433_09380 [Nocardia puris]|uniref:Uncharacterized protein n=1 Tax=Nocardia puris TaxID=208602 RepID=A0A366DUB5_9NOCA|nr:hypothetical protein [Nocardia puris]MBF6210723.1 hypothetical protein [Nocardia puris]MBF6364319.1 hypothetical protein [Nocardia puris]MBF6459248.1 hypothetical protein [Nocardia puris]RBO92798.1 hypothetical protein DFR74_103444 [Nocardia puris]
MRTWRAAPPRRRRGTAPLDRLLTAVEDVDTDDELDDEAKAAGLRIAERLTRRWAADPNPPIALDARRTRIPAWTTTIRAAASSTAAPIQKVTDAASGLEYIRAPGSSSGTRITVSASGDLPAAADLVRVRVLDGGTTPDLLIPLSPTENDRLAGRVITTRIAMSDELEGSIADVSSLDAADALAITESVHAAPIAGRNAWRRIAKRYPDDHPVRAAVLEGLRRR